MNPLRSFYDAQLARSLHIQTQRKGPEAVEALEGRLNKASKSGAVQVFKIAH
jgi:hypothetical protein